MKYKSSIVKKIQSAKIQKSTTWSYAIALPTSSVWPMALSSQIQKYEKKTNYLIQKYERKEVYFQLTNKWKKWKNNSTKVSLIYIQYKSTREKRRRKIQKYKSTKVKIQIYRYTKVFFSKSAWSVLSPKMQTNKSTII